MNDLSSIPEHRRKAEIYMRTATEYGEGPEGFMGGWWSVRIIGELVTDLAIRLDGDLGLLRRYEEVDFLAPVYAGDYLRFRGEVVRVGNTSRTIDFSVDKIIDHGPPLPFVRADFLDNPVRVIQGRAIIVTPKERQLRRL